MDKVHIPLPTTRPDPAGDRSDSRRCAARSCAIGIGIGEFPRRSPATPPDMRVRIRRFEKLRLRRKLRHPQLVEVIMRGHDGPGHLSCRAGF
ncbi:MAG TPA: hypothetical protein DEB40_10765 [Elusimicrobia bacterium]|nr:hypothetical protein [Elusimicrobiota bacterium]HBT62212.1 hypothetical protein [Elusimicrobiota bacterium]